MRKSDIKFGFVALVDALGARTAGIESASSYLASISKLKKEINDLYSATERSAQKHKLKKVNIINQFKPRFFGDTILLTYELKNVRNFDLAFFQIAFVISGLVAKGIDEGILFRGAISIGEFIESEDIVLGPSVIDAANWYETSEMIGVFATPRLRNYMKGRSSDSGLNDVSSIEFDVPCKNNIIFNTYVLNWPDMCDLHFDGKLVNYHDWYHQKLSKFNISPEVQKKYANTEIFFNHCIQIANKSNPEAG